MNKKTILLSTLLATFISGGVLAATEQQKASSAILLQGYHWHSHKHNWFNIMKDQAADIKNLGITHVWFPPVSDSGAAEGYLPRQLNKLDSRYGTKAQLQAATQALSNNGVKSVADIVVNHRVGTTNWADFTNPTWGAWAVTRDDEWGQGTGNWDTGGGYSAARDIDHTNPTVQSGIRYFMKTTLKGAGFSGWRYDYSKGYSPYYAKLYAEAAGANFCVGEVWNNLNYGDVDAHRKQLMDYVDGAGGVCGAFDFTTKGLLNKALKDGEYWRLRDGNGKPAGGIGWWPEAMVTFVDNHDTGPSESCGAGQNHWPVPCGSVMQGYAYILTHPGIPTVYWPHVYDWNMRAAIKKLIDVRKSKGINSKSSVSIKVAEQGRYAAIIDGKVAVKIGWNSWSPGSGWTLKASGTNYAVWTK